MVAQFPRQKLDARQRELLEPWSQAIYSLYRQIEQTPNAELRELLSAAEVCTESNCWCATFDAALLIRKEAGRTLRWREHVGIEKLNRGSTGVESQPGKES